MSDYETTTAQALNLAQRAAAQAITDAIAQAVAQLGADSSNTLAFAEELESSGSPWTAERQRGRAEGLRDAVKQLTELSARLTAETAEVDQ